MKRKWRKRRMMTPRRKAKRVSHVSLGYFGRGVAELMQKSWSFVYYSAHELRALGYDEAIGKPHYSDPS